jgi:MFS family permease
MPRPSPARAATSVAFAVQGLVFASVLTRLPALKDKFAFTDGELTVLLAVVPVVAGLGSVLADRLASRHGGAAVLRWCVLLACATASTVGLAPTRPALYVALTGYGLALGAVDATMNLHGVAVQARHGHSIMNGFHAMWSLAGITGALYTSAVADVAPVSVSVPLAATAGALAMAAVWSRLPLPSPVAAPIPAGDPAPATGAEPGAVAGAPVPWRALLPVGLALGCVYIADSGASNWSAVYLRDTLLSTEGVAALAYAAYQGTALLGRAFGDRLVRRHGTLPVVRVAVTVAVLGLVTVMAAGSPAIAIAGFAVLGLGASVLVPLCFSAAGRLDDGRGTAVARVNLFNYAGFLVGAPLVGVVGSLAGMRYGWLAPLLALAACGLVSRSWCRDGTSRSRGG